MPKRNIPARSRSPIRRKLHWIKPRPSRPWAKWANRRTDCTKRPIALVPRAFNRLPKKPKAQMTKAAPPARPNYPPYMVRQITEHTWDVCKYDAESDCYNYLFPRTSHLNSEAEAMAWIDRDITGTFDEGR